MLADGVCEMYPQARGIVTRPSLTSAILSAMKRSASRVPRAAAHADHPRHPASATWVLERLRIVTKRWEARTAYFRPRVSLGLDPELCALVNQRVSVRLAGHPTSNSARTDQRVYRIVGRERRCLRPECDFDFLD